MNIVAAVASRWTCRSTCSIVVLDLLVDGVPLCLDDDVWLLLWAEPLDCNAYWHIELELAEEEERPPAQA